MNWTPSYSQSGTYEFKIIATSVTASAEDLFVITVKDVNTDAVDAETDHAHHGRHELDTKLFPKWHL